MIPSKELLHQLRLMKGLRQQDVADKIGVSQPTYSRVERKLDYFGARTSAKLARVLALGRPVRGGESAPSYALVQRDPSGRIDLLFTRGRIGLYRDPETVGLAQEILRLAGLTVHVAPLWLQHAFDVINRNGGPKQPPFYVDRYEDAVERVREMMEHVSDLLDELAAVDPEETARQAADLLRASN